MTMDTRKSTDHAAILAELIEGSRAALERAYKRAEKIAAQTGTDLIVVIDGKMVRVKPAMPLDEP